ncbi:MAG: cytochrome c maturation protein CcmE [Deltaproteobacteria bacterium]|nr:MAG: cytochrome c maturation protein CcmE [Deltaproteobacteria bacterium]
MRRPSGRQWAAIAAITVAVGILAVVSFADMGQNLVYYLTPDELLQKGAAAHGKTVRLGGMVQSGSVHFDHRTLELQFNLGMLPSGGTPVAVHASGTPPQMFSEGTGAVVEGTYDGKLFYADRVMVKHSNEYRPPAPGEKPANMYTTLQTPDK